MSPPDCPLPPLNPALHRCRTVSVRLSVYGGILWRPPAWSLFLCVFLFLYVTALQLVDMLFDTKVSLSTTVPDHTHPHPPSGAGTGTDGRPGAAFDCTPRRRCCTTTNPIYVDVAFRQLYDFAALWRNKRR